MCIYIGTYVHCIHDANEPQIHIACYVLCNCTSLPIILYFLLSIFSYVENIFNLKLREFIANPCNLQVRHESIACDFIAYYGFMQMNCISYSIFCIVCIIYFLFILLLFSIYPKYSHFRFFE